MKIFLSTLTAALIIYSQMAFSQTIDECRNRQAITEIAIDVKDALAEGVPEESLLDWANGIESPGWQAAAYKAIDAYTFQHQPGSISQVVTVMQYVCKKTYRQ